MSVTHKQILRITEGANGATVLHLQDEEGVVVRPDWIAKNRPEVGGYLIDNGRGEQWFARNSLSTVPAMLTEVQRVLAKPGELILFKLPPEATKEDGERLFEFVRAAAPELPCIVVACGLEVMAIGAEQAAKACSQSLLADGKPAPRTCARCGLGPCTEKIGEAHP